MDHAPRAPHPAVVGPSLVTGRHGHRGAASRAIDHPRGDRAIDHTRGDRAIDHARLVALTWR